MSDEQNKAIIAVIRTLGFVGNSHYCPGCLNKFHEDRGQHEEGCSVLSGMQQDEEWWDEVKMRLSDR